jgi:outer membrane immunogenic protein
MKKILLATVSLAVLGSSAFAADLQPRMYAKAAPAPIPAPIYNWTGFYIGGHLGGAFNGNDSLGGTNGRFIGGVQAGADFQFAPNWVLGIEGQYTFTDRTTNSTTYPNAGTAGLVVTDRNSNLGSVTGRLGYTWGPALLYAKGGVGFRDSQNVNVTDLAGVPQTFTATTNNTGYTVGGGLEYMFTRNVSAKAEYQYYNFGTTNVTVTSSPALISYRPDEHTFKVGLNYRFGGFGY